MRGHTTGAGASATIVGAGIAGLAAAHALRGLGYEVHVLERDAALRDEGAGLTLWPNATRALRALGLEGVLAQCAHAVHEAVTRTPDGRLLMHVPLAGIEARFGELVSVHRGELLAALADGLSDRIEFGVAVAVRDGRMCAGETDVDADLIIGADGVGSATRELLAGPVAPRPAGYAAWRGVAHTGAATPAAACETFGAGRRFGLVPLTGERTYWFAVIGGDDGGADLAREFSGWHEPIAAVLEATPPGERSFLALADLPRLARWQDGRTVLVGDAAHAMTPNLGQGAAQSLIDVAALTARLSAEPPSAALAGYERERKRRSERVAARSRAVGRLAQASNPVAVRIREALARSMPEALLARQFADLLEP